MISIQQLQVEHSLSIFKLYLLPKHTSNRY